MLAFMKGIKDIELVGLSNQEDQKRAKEIFKEILSMVKCMGKFFATLLLYIYTGIKESKFKSDYQTLSLIMSTMLVPQFIFERYTFFLAKALTIEDQKKWFKWRQEMVRTRQVCTDLVYLNKLIAVEEKRNLIRKNTIQAMSSARLIPKREMDYHVNSYRMDINEFLSHLELKVNLELDDIFSSDLQAIIEYFKHMDEFINQTFRNAELEIKIDLMRLVLRVTTSTKFVNYIYVLSHMNVDFLNECQIFALFCQVLLTELKKPMQAMDQAIQELERGRMAMSERAMRGHEGPVNDKLSNLSSFHRTTTEVNKTTLERLPETSPLRFSCEPDTLIQLESAYNSPHGHTYAQSPEVLLKRRPKQMSRFCRAHEKLESKSSVSSDRDFDSGEQSDGSPWLKCKVNSFDLVKQRNSTHHEHKQLRRIGHIELMSSEEIASIEFKDANKYEARQESDDLVTYDCDKAECMKSTSHNSRDDDVVQFDPELGAVGASLPGLFNVKPVS